VEVHAATEGHEAEITDQGGKLTLAWALPLHEKEDGGESYEGYAERKHDEGQ